MISDVQFSVVVPIFNVGKYLRQCVDSILSSSYDNFELILVDDGSTDECGDICDEYSNNDSRVRVIHKNNGGLVSARQAGASICKGKYVCCVDGDDFVSSDYLQYFADVIEQFKPDIVTCNYITWLPNETGDEKKQNYLGYYDRNRIEKEIIPKLFCDYYGRSILPNIWGKAIRREIYIELQLKVDTALTISEDAAVTRPGYYLVNSVFFGEKANYYYRVNPTSMTRDGRILDWSLPNRIVSIFRKTIDFNKYDFEKQISRYIVHFAFAIICSHFNSDASYLKLKNEIKHNMSLFQYEQSVQAAEFAINTKWYWACFLIKNHIYYPIKIYKHLLR